MDYSGLVSLVSLSSAAISTLYYLWNMRRLPGCVPIYFNVCGEMINRYAPAIIILIYCLLQWARANPRYSNLIVKLTPTNAYRQIDLLQRLMIDLQWINPVILGLQIFINQRNPPTLPWPTAPIITCGILGRLAIYFYNSWKDR